MANRLNKLYAWRPLWMFTYLLFYIIYSANSDDLTFEGAQRYIHGSILALWLLALTTESNLWKLGMNTSLPVYKFLLAMILYVLSLDVFAFYVSAAFRPLYFTASQKNTASMHTFFLGIAIFAFDLAGIFLAYIGQRRSYADNEFVQQRPSWVSALRQFRLTFCLLALLVGQGTRAFLLYAFVDVGWTIASMLTSYYHDKNEESSDLVDSFEEEAKEYNLEMRIAALERRGTVVAEAVPKALAMPTAHYTRLPLVVFYSNVGWCCLAVLLSNNAAPGNANDLMFFLCLLCLVSSAFDTVGVVDYKDDEELEEIEEEAEQIWTVAADDFVAGLPLWMQGYGHSLSHNAVAAIENFDASAASLGRAMQISQFRNQIDYSKDKLDDPEAAMVRVGVVSATESSSVRRRTALKF
jgi:hypothetical protein